MEMKNMIGKWTKEQTKIITVHYKENIQIENYQIKVNICNEEFEENKEKYAAGLLKYKEKMIVLKNKKEIKTYLRETI